MASLIQNLADSIGKNVPPAFNDAENMYLYTFFNL